MFVFAPAARAPSGTPPRPEQKRGASAAAISLPAPSLCKEASDPGARLRICARHSRMTLPDAGPAAAQTTLVTEVRTSTTERNKRTTYPEVHADGHFCGVVEGDRCRVGRERWEGRRKDVPRTFYAPGVISAPPGPALDQLFRSDRGTAAHPYVNRYSMWHPRGWRFGDTMTWLGAGPLGSDARHHRSERAAR